MALPVHNNDFFKIADCGECALLIDFGGEHSRNLSLSILNLSDTIDRKHIEGILETLPALSSLTVFYDPFRLDRQSLIDDLLPLLRNMVPEHGNTRNWSVPVVYGGLFGPDLRNVAETSGLSEADVIGHHCASSYFVYMLGFLPGFAYLGDLHTSLRLPRRSTPRSAVPAGSIAIAANMTAIYPLESPGGWNIIGYTPITLWDPRLSNEPLLRPGDNVRFHSIDEAEADSLKQKIAEGWTLQAEPIP